MLAGIQWAAAQSITVDVPREVGQGEPFHITFTVKGENVGSVRPPSLDGLDVFSGPSQSRGSSYQNINGRSSSFSFVSYSYMVAARQVGKLTIGSAYATVAGRTVSSSPVTINVVKGNVHAQSPVSSVSRNMQLQQAGSPISSADMYITATLSRASVYEQEGVLLTYHLYARPQVGVKGVALTHRPDFANLVSQEIPVRNVQASLENIGGKTYQVATIARYMLYPQKSGDIPIPGVEFTCTVQQQEQFDDPIDAFFNGGGVTEVNVKRTVKPLTLHAKALPKPAPAAFSGGVGHFQVKGELITPLPASNDQATYRITISGSGNMKLLTPPNVVFPKGFDLYDPKTTDETQLTDEGMKGKMVFEYTFVPREKGKYTIPATSFVYFDTQEGRYVTLNTAPLTLNVEQGTRTDADVERDAALRKSDIQPIHSGPTASESGTWWGSWSYLLSYIIVLVLGIFALRFSLHKLDALADVAGRRGRKAGKVARRHLQHASDLLNQGNEGAFLDELSHALYGYLADKYNVSASELSKERIGELLAKDAVSQDVISQISHIFEVCEYARFASSSADFNCQQLYAQALSAIDSIEAKR